MGIYDREYIRMGPRSRSGLGGLRFVSFNTWLIVLNVAVFALDWGVLARWPVSVVVGNEYRDGVSAADRERGVVLSRPLEGDPIRRVFYRPIAVQRDRGFEIIGRQVMLEPRPPLEAMGHFSTSKVLYGLEVWRFITFQFLHGGALHLFFNMFGLWIFGGMVEQYLGFKRYAAFYLVCGIFGAVAYLILNFLGGVAGLSLPGVVISEPYTPLVGASAGVFGVIVASAFIAPHAMVVLLFPPIPLPLWLLAYGYVGIALLNLLRGGPNAGGDAAHVGGAIAGYYFIRNTHLLRDFFDFFGGSRRGSPASRVSAAEGEIDRILTKVSDAGLGSLSATERDTLRRHAEWLRRHR